MPKHLIPQTINTKQSSAQPVESAGNDRPGGRAVSTRASDTITKTVMIPMSLEGSGSQKDFASRLFTHHYMGADHPKHTILWTQRHGGKPPENMQFYTL